jgi:hypothetical protein
MAEHDRELSREELEQTEGEPLPAREVMSLIDPDPSQFSVLPVKPETMPTEHVPPNDV